MPGQPGEFTDKNGKPVSVQDGAKGLKLREREDAKFQLRWLTASGTSVLLAALVSIPLLRMSREQVGKVFRKTFWQMRIPIPTIGFMLGLSYVTKYAGMDATLGVAFAETGVLYPFFGLLLSPVVAAAAMALSSVSVIGNALRLRAVRVE